MAWPIASRRPAASYPVPSHDRYRADHLEATGVQAPVWVKGIAQKPIEGVSMAYTFDKANANAPSARTTQYFEMFGIGRSIMTAGSPPRRARAAVAHGHAGDARRGQRL